MWLGGAAAPEPYAPDLARLRVVKRLGAGGFASRAGRAPSVGAARGGGVCGRGVGADEAFHFHGGWRGPLARPNQTNTRAKMQLYM